MRRPRPRLLSIAPFESLCERLQILSGERCHLFRDRLDDSARRLVARFVDRELQGAMWGPELGWKPSPTWSELAPLGAARCVDEVMQAKHALHGLLHLAPSRRSELGAVERSLCSAAGTLASRRDLAAACLEPLPVARWQTRREQGRAQRQANGVLDQPEAASVRRPCAPAAAASVRPWLLQSRLALWPSGPLPLAQSRLSPCLAIDTSAARCLRSARSPTANRRVHALSRAQLQTFSAVCA